MFDEIKIREFEIGELVKGAVVIVAGDTIFVNIGAKSEAQLPIAECPEAKPDDTLECIITGRDKDGTFILSYEQAQEQLKIEEYEKALESGEAKTALIAEATRGGIIVRDGVRIFIPNSQLLNKIRSNPKKYFGKRITFNVIDKNRNDFIGSQMKYENSKREKRQQDFWDKIDLDKEYTVKVKAVFPNKAFVECESVKGFITAKNYSYDWIEDLGKVLKPFSEFQAKILTYNRESERVEFTRKPLIQDPEQDYLDKYQVDKVYKGVVVRVAKDYAIIQFDDFARGKIELEDLSWSRKIRFVSQVLKEGDAADVKIIGYDKERRLFNVGLKQIIDNPWTDAKTKYAPGAIVEGKITKIIPAGFFMELEPELEGFVPKSDIAWEKDEEKVIKGIKEGDSIKALVLELDVGQRKMRLGLKQLTEDPFVKKTKGLSVGKKIKGKVTGVNSGGFIVDVKGVEAFMPMGEVLSSDKDGIKEGTELEAVIKEINAKTRRVILSTRLLAKKETAEVLKSYKSKKEFTMGDLWTNIAKKK